VRWEISEGARRERKRTHLRRQALGGRGSSLGALLRAGRVLGDPLVALGLALSLALALALALSGERGSEAAALDGLLLLRLLGLL
jgi:hypothetical protein